MTKLMEDTKIDNDRDRSTPSATDANATICRNRWLPYDMDESSLGIDHTGDDDNDDITNRSDVIQAHWNV